MPHVFAGIPTLQWWSPIFLGIIHYHMGDVQKLGVAHRIVIQQLLMVSQRGWNIMVWGYYHISMTTSIYTINRHHVIGPTDVWIMTWHLVIQSNWKHSEKYLALQDFWTLFGITGACFLTPYCLWASHCIVLIILSGFLPIFYCPDFGVLKYGYGSIPIIPFLGEWTSIYQLFWCSPGVQGFDTLPYGENFNHRTSWFFELSYFTWFHLGPQMILQFNTLFMEKPGYLHPNFRKNHHFSGVPELV